MRIRCEDGTVGWGEAQRLIDMVPAAFAKGAEIAQCYDVRNVERLHRHVFGADYYHHKRAAVMAISALEMAMRDAFGRIVVQPLWALWAGLWRGSVRASAYTFTADPTALAARLRAFADDGFETFKVKIGFDAASDIALVIDTGRTYFGGDIVTDAPVCRAAFSPCLTGQVWGMRRWSIDIRCRRWIRPVRDGSR